MARKLKTFTTSAGFFDLAVSAPSMKAALEAWGSKSNLFHQGFAKVSEDQAIVAATLAKPGIVLRRPVGTKAAFSEKADLPEKLWRVAARKAEPKNAAHRRSSAPKPVDDQTQRAATRAFEQEQKRRRLQEQREQATRQRDAERRARAITKAKAAFEAAENAHHMTLQHLEKERAELEQKLQDEETRWQARKEELERNLRKAREQTYLRLV